MLRICACMMHFYACIVQNMCMLEINVCPNIYVLETYLHVRNTCMIEIYIHAGTQPAIFQGRRGLVELGHFYKHFVENTRKKGPARKNSGVFSARYPQGRGGPPPPPLSSPLVARLPCQKYISMSEMYAYQKYICKYFQESMHVRNILYACQKDFHIFLEVYGI